MGSVGLESRPNRCIMPLMGAVKVQLDSKCRSNKDSYLLLKEITLLLQGQKTDLCEVEVKVGLGLLQFSIINELLSMINIW